MKKTKTMLLISIPGGTELIIVTIGLLLSIIGFVIWIIALIDIVNGEFKESSQKTIWLLITIFLGALGALIYLIFGKKQKI